MGWKFTVRCSTSCSTTEWPPLKDSVINWTHLSTFWHRTGMGPGGMPASCSTTWIRSNTIGTLGCCTSRNLFAVRGTSPQAAGFLPQWMTSEGVDSLQNDGKAPGGIHVQTKVTAKNGTMRNSGDSVCRTAQVSQDLRLDERWGRSSYPKSKF
jgi:hypothetical protein